MKKIILISLLSCIMLNGCKINNNDVIYIDTTTTEERGGIYTIEDNTIKALAGSKIDFNLISQKRNGHSIKVTKFNVLKTHKNKNVEVYENNDKGFTLLSDYKADTNGITTFNFLPEENSIYFYHIGNDDEAEIEVLGIDGQGNEYKERFIIQYYCNCEK